MTSPFHGNDDTVRADLRATIDGGMVRTVFQPIIDLDRVEVRAYEALTRLQEGSAFSNPGELFDAAERVGMLWELEMLTRRTALEAASDWPAGVLLFLNCSPQVFADERFAETLLAEIEAVPGLSPRRVVLEVTERSEHQHVEGLHTQASVLQEHGFQLAIDDVGAGTSGLLRIMLLRPDWLKLDRALVDQIDRDPVKVNLVRFLTHFAKTSGVRIIGEGVERHGELEQLIGLGVHCAQGFLLGRPGETGQEIPEELAGRLSAGRGDAGSRIAADGLCERLSRIIRPARTVEAGTAIALVAEQLDAEPDADGVVVLEDGALLGWCGRKELLVRAADGSGRGPVGSAAEACERTLSASASIEEALEFASSLDSLELTRPIVVTEHGRVTGVIEPIDLFGSAAEACRSVEHRVAPLTGLHGRVRCEQRVEQAIACGDDLDAVFIDIRGLAEYNAVFGFELGDELIKQLVEVVEDVVRSRFAGSQEIFLGHLGDDRLLLLAPPGQTDELAADVLGQFEARVSQHGISPQAALSGLGVSSATATIGVRFLGVRGFAASHADALDLLRVEPTLRALADERAAMKPVSAGSVVIVDSSPPPESLRLAA